MDAEIYVLKDSQGRISSQSGHLAIDHFDHGSSVSSKVLTNELLKFDLPSFLI